MKVSLFSLKFLKDGEIGHFVVEKLISRIEIKLDNTDKFEGIFAMYQPIRSENYFLEV